MAEPMVLNVVKLGAFSYQRFPDGRCSFGGADGKPLPTGAYAVDIGGKELTVLVMPKTSSSGFAEAERLRQENAEAARGR